MTANDPTTPPDSGLCHCGCGQATRHGRLYVHGHNRRRPAVDRFWAKVDKSPGFGPSGDCWRWTGAISRAGYGVMNRGGRTALTHRLSFELAHGSIPAGASICHRCDNPPCCNPDHLFAGAPVENSADMVAKGRQLAPGPTRPALGERHGQARLTASDVPVIRAAFARKDDLAALARQLGVSRSAVEDVAKGRTWRHIP